MEIATTKISLQNYSFAEKYEILPLENYLLYYIWYPSSQFVIIHRCVRYDSSDISHSMVGLGIQYMYVVLTGVQSHLTIHTHVGGH